MIVVDAGVIVALVCDHPLHADAVVLLERDSEWIAPILWQSEVRNVIGCKLFALTKQVTRDEGVEAYRDALEVLRPGTREVDPERCLRTVIRYGLSGYDAEYVTLAEREQVDLVTTDTRMVKKLFAGGFERGRLLG